MHSNKIVTVDKKIIILPLTAAILLLIFIVQNAEYYLKPYDHNFYSRIYTNSPYVKGQAATEGIGDDGLYAFAGYYYIRGGDITQVNFENPPLGKYLIGLSIVLFGNQNFINIIYAVIFLVALYFLSFLALRNHYWSGLTILITSIDPFFRSQLLFSLLDFPMVVFFMTGTIFYIFASKRSSWLFKASSIFFGLSISSKFFPGFILFLGVFLIDYLYNKKLKPGLFVFSMALIPLVYLLNHVAYFFYHPSLLDFIRYQYWILHWRLGNPIVWGNIFTNLLTGRYRSWWGVGEWLIDKEWSPVIAVLTLLALGSLSIAWKKNKPARLFYSLMLVFLLYVGLDTVGVAKYIFPIYPFFLTLAVLVIKERSAFLSPSMSKNIKKVALWNLIK